MLRKIRIVALRAAAALGALATSATAQTLPNQPIIGQVYQQLSGSCYVKRGPVTFQRKFSSAITAGARAVVFFKEIFAGLDSNALNVGYELSGEALMIFSTPTSGNIRFRQLLTAPQNYHYPAFSNYSETFNAAAQQLTVRFVISFPNCTLPIFLALDPVL